MNIERLDDLGRGIGYLDGKITFIPWTIPGDVVEVIVTENHKKYNVAKVKQFIKYSEKRIQPPCPYFTKCGGCTLQNLAYNDTLEYKVKKIKNI